MPLFNKNAKTQKTAISMKNESPICKNQLWKLASNKILYKLKTKDIYQEDHRAELQIPASFLYLLCRAFPGV